MKQNEPTEKKQENEPSTADRKDTEKEQHEEDSALADDPNCQDIPDATEADAKPVPHSDQFSHNFQF